MRSPAEVDLFHRRPSSSTFSRTPSSSAILLPTILFANKPPDDAQKERILKKAYRMQIPFIENKGQIENKDVGFYAKTFGGTVFVEKSGTLTYNLPVKDKGGVVIKEIFTDKKIKAEGLDPSPTKVNYFIGNDKSKNVKILWI